ncbi:hypothetical protein ZIOFF_020037 [Zingiber officinale]|uniref:Electron transfer flavoprotein alpha/beta-subunit N-terminal domain-containing protein n=1 Tax=Zingiber officinale TaxID=94328 RepID=A0A8J5LC08_ZINOF|nr:hypothetical protein ZIOFF_020037 [Zingiber officinale]
MGTSKPMNVGLQGTGQASFSVAYGPFQSTSATRGVLVRVGPLPSLRAYEADRRRGHSLPRRTRRAPLRLLPHQVVAEGTPVFLLFSPLFDSIRRRSVKIRVSISTLVLAEHEGGFVKQSSLSAVAAAAAVNKEKSVSVLLGGSGPSLLKAASHAASCHPSISQVLVADTDILLHPLAETWAELVRLVQKQGSYSHIISASNSFGKNVLPRAAALLDVSPVTDVIEISEPRLFTSCSDFPHVSQKLFAYETSYQSPVGNALSTVRYMGEDPCMMTIRSTSFTVSACSSDSKSSEAPISKVDLSSFNEASFPKSRWLKLASQESERPDLGNARTVVTGGRGLKSAENFKLLEKLAEKLGAAVGATRAAVDAGFVPNDLQVGQTGKIVAPELYMAFGVSGAIQHIAGMRDSKVIVAVNKDADAPIFQVVHCAKRLQVMLNHLVLSISFLISVLEKLVEFKPSLSFYQAQLEIVQVADYGLVADLFDVIPELIEKIPDKK